MTKVRFWVVALLALLAAPLASAQNVTVHVVTSCGLETIPTTAPAWLRIDTTGALCTSATGSVTSAVTIADGADVAEGSTTATAATAGGTGSVSAKLRLMTTQLGTISSALGTPFQAGGNIGNTAFTANAGTNLNTSLLALEAGGNLAGLVTQLGAVAASPTANTVNDRLKTINTTLGSPFQAGGALAANQSVNVAQINGTTTVLDPCHGATATYTPISITSATTTRIVAPTSAKRTYVCYMFLLSAIANNIGIVEGTGGTCGSSTAGVVGGTTAANGINLAANSGAVFQAGGDAAVATVGTNVDLCLITSSAGPVAGHIKWVQAP